MNNCDMLTESFPNDCSYQNILCKRGDVVLVYTIILWYQGYVGLCKYSSFMFMNMFAIDHSQSLHLTLSWKIFTLT